MRSLPPVLGRAVLAALDLLWPPRCLACDEPAWEAGPPLCPPCAASLGPPRPRCLRCGRGVGPYAPPPPCPRCREEDVRLDGVVAAWPYTGVARSLVLALKYRGRPEAASLLAPAMGEAVREAGVPGDLVVPVPLSARRRRRRGYDQAALLAGALATGLGLEGSGRALVRWRHTVPQVGQSPSRRRRGPRGAFRADSGRVRGRCVLLVDDVLTTGATAEAAAAALRRGGARSVVAVVACRAEGPGARAVPSDLGGATRREGCAGPPAGPS